MLLGCTLQSYVWIKCFPFNILPTMLYYTSFSLRPQPGKGGAPPPLTLPPGKAAMVLQWQRGAAGLRVLWVCVTIAFPFSTVLALHITVASISHRWHSQQYIAYPGTYRHLRTSRVKHWMLSFNVRRYQKMIYRTYLGTKHYLLSLKKTTLVSFARTGL